MSEQLSMLDLWEPKPSFALGSIDPHGKVLQGEADETLILPHPRMAWDRARIELHQHTDGRWMWSSSYGLEEQSSGYKVGPKWGRFAETRAGALHGAVTELSNAIDERRADKAGAAILSWARNLS